MSSLGTDSYAALITDRIQKLIVFLETVLCFRVADDETNSLVQSGLAGAVFFRYHLRERNGHNNESGSWFPTELASDGIVIG